MKQQDYHLVHEGATDCLIPKQDTTQKGPGTKQGPAFYNPAMEMNRDCSLVVTQWFLNQHNKTIHILDGLAASGIRGVRFGKELEGDFTVFINDGNTACYELIQKNIKHNNLSHTIACNKPLHQLLAEQRFDMIDIDPFGSPAIYISAAVQNIRHQGLLSCTATDTATLCGVYPKVCQRRYAATPFYGPQMNEIGVRILLGMICREAAVYDKGIKPILSYADDHYFRVYVQIFNGKSAANHSMQQYKRIHPPEFSSTKNKECIGPLWIGALQEKSIIQYLRTAMFDFQLHTKHQLWKLFDQLEEEAHAPVFFFSTDDLASKFKTSAPSLETIKTALQKQGYKAIQTHFHPTGIKTNAPNKIISQLFTDN